MKRFLLCILALLLLCACSSGIEEVSYPVMDAVDITGLDLTEVGNDQFKVAYPADSWTGEPDSDPLNVFLNETLDTDFAVNINIQYSGQWPSRTLDQTDLDGILSAMQEEAPFMSIGLHELRSLNGQTVIYMESDFCFTDEAIDFMLEKGGWTEEYLDEIGGREALLAIPPTKAAYVYALVDDDAFVYTATYDDDTHKQTALDAMTVMVQTTELKETQTQV